MADIQKTSESTFQQEVLESSLPVLVDFTAVWCGPCKMLDPIVQQLAEEWTDKVVVYKLDVDDYPQLATNYQIMGVPTLMLFNNGQPVERVTGYQPKNLLLKRFAIHLD